MSKRELSEEEQLRAYELAINRKSLSYIAEVLGFKGDWEFLLYRRAHPLFSKNLDAARVDACDHLEDDMLNAADNLDPKAARVKMESIKNILSYRKPEKYSQRIDLNVTQSLNYTAVLEAASRRVVEALTPELIAPIKDDSET